MRKRFVESLENTLSNIWECNVKGKTDNLRREIEFFRGVIKREQEETQKALDLSQIGNDPIYVIVTKGGNWSSGKIGQAFRVIEFVAYPSGFKAYVDNNGTTCGLWWDNYRFPTQEEYAVIKEADLDKHNRIQEVKRRIESAEADLNKYKERLKEIENECKQF